MGTIQEEAPAFTLEHQLSYKVLNTLYISD